MSRFKDLLETVETYQELATENYDRIRTLAEELKKGMCEYLNADDGVCIHLVPPMGPFEPREYAQQAYSIPPRGFRPLGPVAFGLAVRVTKGTDWLRVTLLCRKIGDSFIVQIQDGAEYEVSMPLKDADPEPLYEHIYQHVQSWFSLQIERYRDGDYASREIGFDFADDVETAQV